MAHRRQKAVQEVGPGQLEGGGGKAGMTADEVPLHQLPVYHQLHLPLPVVHQLKGAGRPGGGPQQLHHMLRCGEGQPGAAQLGGDVLGFEGLVPRHHQQVEVGLLPVGEQQVLADGSAQHLFHRLAVLHGVGIFMVTPLVGDAQLIQKGVHRHLIGVALLRGRTAVYVGIHYHGLHLLQGVGHVLQNVVDVLNAHAEAHQVGRDAGGGQLLIGHLAVGGGGGVQGAGLGVGHMGGDGGQLQTGHEFGGRLTASLDAKGHHTAGAVRHILLSPLVVGVPLQAGVAHPGHLGVVLQELGHSQAVLAVLCHPQRQGLQADVEIIAVLRGGDSAQVPHELNGGLGDIGPLQAEALGVGDTVVALVGGGQAGELVGVGVPVKLAGVHDSAAHRVGVAVHVLGGGVGDDISAPLKGPAVHRGGKGVVHNERHPVGVGRLGKFLDVQHGEGRIGDGLAEHRPGLGPEGCVQLLLGAIRVHKGEVNAHPLHGDGKEVVGAAVDGGGADHVLPAGDDVENGIEGSSLTGGGKHGRGSPLQGADLGGHMVVGGVLQPGVKISAGLQVEESPHLLAGGVPEGGGLDNGDVPGLSVAGSIARVDTLGTDTVLAHGLILPFYAWVPVAK